MTEEELYENMPQDPELAFLHLERFYREQCEAKVNNAHQDERVGNFWVEYIGRVLAALEELGLTGNFSTSNIPKVENIDYDSYLNFGKEVEHFRTGLLIRHGRRTQGFSVKFDEAAKRILRHHLSQMREVIDRLEVEQNKRESLFAKVNALEQEVDRDRTRYDSFAALTIETAGLLDTTLEPINKLLTNIARVFWGAKEEEMKKLPPPKTPKRIEGPRDQKQPPSKQKTRGDLDDEIPF
jgi:hypothetical protein